MGRVFGLTGRKSHTECAWPTVPRMKFDDSMQAGAATEIRFTMKTDLGSVW